MSYYILGGLVSAAVAIGTLYALYSSAQRECAELHDALNASQARVEELKADLARQAAVLAERDTKITKLNADKGYLNKMLREAAAHDETVKSWSDTPIPAAVDSLLKAGGENADGSGVAAAALPPTAVAGQNQRRPD